MKSILSLSLYIILICISAGCVAEDKENVLQGSDLNAVSDQKMVLPIYLITPDEGFLCYGNQAVFRELNVNKESPDANLNYSIGYITVESKKTTAPHRQLNRSEYIFVTGGEAEIMCDEIKVTAKEGESVILPKGALQSVTSTGDGDLLYISVISPAYSEESLISGEDLSKINFTAEEIPIKIPDPKKGIKWDIGSDMMIYSLANPVLMPDMDLPFEYSVAYAELLPGGVAENNTLKGSSELICVIEGEIEVYTKNGESVTAVAGDSVYVTADQEKGYINSGKSISKILSFTDPAWTPQIWVE